MCHWREQLATDPAAVTFAERLSEEPSFGLFILHQSRADELNSDSNEPNSVEPSWFRISILEFLKLPDEPFEIFEALQPIKLSRLQARPSFELELMILKVSYSNWQYYEPFQTNSV